MMSGVSSGVLADLIAQGGVVALTGAGMSTDSGIPDYRGTSGAAVRRHAPMTFQEFTRDPAARHRYWARSHAGWPMMRGLVPNGGHRALAALEASGHIEAVITQNVDGLHATAGSKEVVDLHGRLNRVVCLDCAVVFPRDEIEDRIGAANPEWRARPRVRNPDGDVTLDDSDVTAFVMVDCPRCHGVLKPDVVYFGESVPPERVAASYAHVEQARALLVLGSSLHVFSGRRFVTRAAERDIPIAVVNQGPTRADDLAEVRVDGSISEVLMAVNFVRA